MSVEAASQFIEKVYSDEGLRHRLETQVGDIVHTNLAPNRSAGETLAHVGKEQGFEFTALEGQAAYKSFVERQMQSSKGELSEDELEAVAGGQICENTLCKNTCGSGGAAASKTA